MKKTQYSRIINKRTYTSGLVPTIGPSEDHTDGSWTGDTMIYPGEFYVNLADEKLWFGWATGDTSANTYSTGVTQIYPYTGTSNSSGATLNITGSTNLYVSGASPDYYITFSGSSNLTSNGWWGYYEDNLNGTYNGGTTTSVVLNTFLDPTLATGVLFIKIYFIANKLSGSAYDTYSINFFNTWYSDGTDWIKQTVGGVDNYVFSGSNGVFSTNNFSVVNNYDTLNNRIRLLITSNAGMPNCNFKLVTNYWGIQI